MIEDDRRGQPHPADRRQPVTQLHGRERIEAEVLEVRLDTYVVRRAVPEDLGDRLAYDVGDDAQPSVLVQSGEPGLQFGTVRGGADRGPAPDAPRHVPQDRRHAVGGERADVDPCGDDHGRVVSGGAGRVEEGEPLVVEERFEAARAQAGQVGVVEVPGHGAAACPQSPGDGEAGQTGGAAVGDEGVDEGVGGGVPGLTGVAEDAGGGGEGEEQGQGKVRGGRVEVRGDARFRRPDRRQPVGVLGGDDGVVQHPGGMDHPGQPVDGGDQFGGCLRVREVGGDDPDVRAESGEPLGEFAGTGGVGALPPGEHETPYRPGADQVFGDQRTHHAGAARDQHGAVGVQDGTGARGEGGAGEAGDQRTAFAYGELRLAGGEGARQGRTVPTGICACIRARARARVQQDELTGVFGLRAADQPPYGGGRGVDGLGVLHRHRLTGDQYEPGVGEARFG
ncbi:hypothetical protein Saa2_00825 [Streptomyces acidiscabies]|nr:hypothetical protein Saa2_00825 [Streptomyces acidiscabies]